MGNKSDNKISKTEKKSSIKKTKPKKKQLTPSNIKNKKKVGRPTRYNAKFHPLLARVLARQGLIDTQISKEMGINEATLNNWKKKYPEFFKSLKIGKASKDDEVEAKLLKNAIGYEHPDTKVFCNADGRVTVVPITKHYQPNVTAQIFWLKNRRPKDWRDKIDMEVDMDETMKETINGLVEQLKNGGDVKLGKGDKVIEVDGKNVEKEIYED